MLDIIFKTYYTNFYYEVLTELGHMLSEHGMFLPKEIHLQWDNSGENKVWIQYNFTLLDLLLNTKYSSWYFIEQNSVRVQLHVG
jgi:hypothetical protein